MQINLDNKNITVIVTVDGSKEAIQSIVDHASSGLSIFKKFNGFIGGATHLNDSGTRVVQYLQWRDEASHSSCMNDPIWSHTQSSKDFMALVKTGAIEMKVDIFKVVNVADSDTEQD